MQHIPVSIVNPVKCLAGLGDFPCEFLALQLDGFFISQRAKWKAVRNQSDCWRDVVPLMLRAKGRKQPLWGLTWPCIVSPACQEDRSHFFDILNLFLRQWPASSANAVAFVAGVYSVAVSAGQLFLWFSSESSSSFGFRIASIVPVRLNGLNVRFIASPLAEGPVYFVSACTRP